MPANDSDSPASEIPDAYARDDATAAGSADAPVTLSDLKSDAAETSSNETAPTPPGPDAAATDSESGDSQQCGAAESTAHDEVSVATRDMDAIKSEILEGIGRHGDRRWSQLGAYHTPVNKVGKLVKVHLDDATWYCLLEEQPRALATRYTIQAMGTHLQIHPLVPDMETLVAALNSQRHHDVQDGQAEPVAPLSAEQRRQFKWEYAHLTMDTLEHRRLAAEQRSTESRLTLYSQYAIVTVGESALRDRVAEVVSPQQLEVVLDTLWEAVEANPAIPQQLLSQSTGRVPLVGRLRFQ